MLKFKPKDPLTVAREQLHETELQLLTHQSWMEYYSAVTAMLQGRIERLKVDIELLSQKGGRR